MIFGAVAMLAAVFTTSLCKEYYQFFLAQGLLLGLGMSFVAIPASGMVPRYFKEHKGTATGISVAGSSLGGVVWPIVFDQLFHHDGVSFEWSMRAAGFIMMPLLLIVVQTVRSPIKTSHDAEARIAIDDPEKPAETEGIEKTCRPTPAAFRFALHGAFD